MCALRLSLLRGDRGTLSGQSRAKRHTVSGLAGRMAKPGWKKPSGQTRPASGPPACSPLYWKCSPLPSLNQSVLPSRAVSSEKLPEPRRAPCRVCRHPTRPHGAASAVATLSSAQSVDVCLLSCDEVGDDLCPFRHRNPASVAPAAPRAQKALIAVF